jgi:hypothetical protein
MCCEVQTTCTGTYQFGTSEGEALKLWVLSDYISKPMERYRIDYRLEHEPLRIVCTQKRYTRKTQANIYQIPGGIRQQICKKKYIYDDDKTKNLRNQWGKYKH